MRGYKAKGQGSNPWFGVFFGSLFTIFIIGGIFCGYLFYSSVREVVAHAGLRTFVNVPIFRPRESDLPVPDWGRKERVNVLLLGVDERPQEEGPCRTDTMILVTVDPATNSAGMLSIPRDLYVEIPGYGLNRINVAHFIGDRDNHPGGGPALAKKTVQYNLGVPIHYYVRINFQGFRDIIDTLGGITVEVEREIRDDRYPDENYGYMTIYIPAGVQQMDGEMALRYARTRHNGSDFMRLRRQQEVLFAIREKALGLDLIPRLPELFSTMGYTVDTDLGPEEVLALAQIARQIEKEDIRSAVIDETMAVSVILPDTGANVLYPLRDKIAEVVEEVFSSPAEGEE
jgi:LCP family protein required for cell wall assembly